MNVCLISREYPPHFGGGIGTYTRHFAAALASQGHRAVVVTVSADGREHREDEGGVAVVRLPFLNGGDWSAPHATIRTPETLAAFRTFHPVSVLGMQIAAALPRIVGEFGIDVIEAPECGALAWFALNGRRCGRGWGPNEGNGPPLVTHLHSPTAWIERWNGVGEGGRAAAWLKRMEEESVRWSDGLVCPSGPLARWAEATWRLRPGLVEVIPYPLGPLEEQAIAGTARGGADEASGCRVLYAGRLEPRKGVDTLLAGFVRCALEGMDLTLELAGWDIADPATGLGFGRRWVESLVPESHRRRVRLHGELGPDGLARLRRESHVAVVPSPMDNYPYTLIEAMAAGLPIVASRAGGMAELVRDGVDGVLFEPRDAESCAAALRRCASNDERARLGPAAAARVLDVCGNSRVVERRVAHYERVVGEHRRRRPARPGAASLTVIAPRDVDASAAGPLAAALNAATAEAAPSGERGPAFAHGWTRVRPPAGANGAAARVLAFGTPTLESLVESPRLIGPLVVRRDVLDDPRVKGRFGEAEAEGEDGAAVLRADPWWAALVLAAAGYAGVVVPWAVVEAPARSMGDAEPGAAWRTRAEAAEAELRLIKGSRGWRALHRLRQVLRVLKRGPEGVRSGRAI